MNVNETRQNILIELLQRNLNDLAQTLAQAFAERDSARARVAELEKQLSPKPDTTPEAGK